mgnify:CR=1 FL=1|tara:strand:- start:4392 stop:4739 length:348 start_codon:yes stop_codon:yes gene_type:complete
MWFDILKRSNRRIHKFNVRNKLVPAYLETIAEGKEFKLTEILIWAKKELENGRDFRTPRVEDNEGNYSPQFPNLQAIGQYVKEKPLKTLMSEVTVRGNHGLQLSQTPKIYRKNLV